MKTRVTWVHEPSGLVKVGTFVRVMEEFPSVIIVDDGNKEVAVHSDNILPTLTQEQYDAVNASFALDWLDRPAVPRMWAAQKWSEL